MWIVLDGRGRFCNLPINPANIPSTSLDTCVYNDQVDLLQYYHEVIGVKISGVIPWK